MPRRITIDEADIRAIERALGNVRFDDDHRMAALLCCDSCDIQACPGSGKTTLLVAKLAILARKWRWKDRGILVLSHTNVARNEIEERLSGIGGHQLLSYPHFVGTIQKFTHQFLALPHLRSKGVTDARIDSGLFARRLVERYVTKQFAWPKALRREWRRNPKLRKKLVGLRYEFNDGELRVGSREGRLVDDDSNSPAATTPKRDQRAPSFILTKELLKVILEAKNYLAKEEGIFCYDDMYALAQKYTGSRPWVAEALGWRFPWVFIDEMQDTDGLQEQLLQVALGDTVNVQRIGDTNQAIFGSILADEVFSGSFPATGALQLPGSLRYCTRIAEMAKPLTRAQDYQNLVGNSDVPSKGHTIFTFTRETIRDVLPAFGRLLLEEYSQGLPEKFRARAVGARKTGKPKKEENFPFCISDYFDGFSATAANVTSFLSLLEFALNGHARFEESGDFYIGWNVLVDGCLELLRLQQASDTATVTDENSRPRRYSKTSLLEQICRAGHESELRLLAFALQVGRVNLEDQASWEVFSDDLRRILGDSLDIQGWNEDSKRFCEWGELSHAGGETKGRTANTYVHKNTPPMPDFEIKVSTIHACKGETHTATLVLDTFERTSDLKAVLPFLLGSQKVITPSLRKRMKRTFVAMTRPRELLCLALRRDHISSTQRRELGKSWNFVDL